MWVKVDDGFPDHDKALDASERLGGAPGSLGRVIGLWLVGMCYCNRNLTDGFIRAAVLRTWVLCDKRPVEVADAMVGAGLLEHVEGGYRFHDYDQYQPSAETVKAKRAADLERKRRRKLPRLPLDLARNSTRNPNGIPTDSAWNPAGVAADSSVPVPLPDPGTRKCIRARRLAPPAAFAEINLPVLKAIVWAEVQAGLDAGEADWGDLMERVKVAAARAGIDYDAPTSSAYLHDQFGLALRRLTDTVLPITGT